MTTNMTPLTNEAMTRAARLDSALRNLRMELSSPQGSVPSALQDLEVIVTAIHERQERAEKALSETMGQVHELDNIVCGLLHRVHHLEKPGTHPICPPQVRVEHWAFINRSHG